MQKIRLVGALLCAVVAHNALGMAIEGGDICYLSSFAVAANAKSQLDHILADNPAVILDFYADWCNPCKMLGGRLEKIAPQYPNVIFLKVNVDQFREVASAYDVKGLPTLIFFKNGKQVFRTTGTGVIASLASEIKSRLL